MRAPLLSLLLHFLRFVALHSVDHRLRFGPRRNLDAAPTHRLRQSRHGIIQTNDSRHEHFHRRDARRLGPVRGIQPELRLPHLRIELRRIELAQVPNATLFTTMSIIELRNPGLKPALVVVARKRHVGGDGERGVRQRRHDVGPQIQYFRQPALRARRVNEPVPHLFNIGGRKQRRVNAVVYHVQFGL